MGKHMNAGRGLLVSLVLFVVAGGVSQVGYKTSPRRAVDIEGFQRRLEKKEAVALRTLQELQEDFRGAPVDTLVNYPFPDDDISYYVIDGDELVFWSDNRLDISNVSVRDFKEWHFLQLPNAYCILLAHEHEDLSYVALLAVKYNYPYENSKLVNRFAHGLDMDKRVGITAGNAEDEYAVFCSHGHYLFSLEQPDAPVYDERWAQVSGAAYIMAFLLFFFLYARFPVYAGKRRMAPGEFWALLVVVGAAVALALHFNVPSTLFGNAVFSPFHYAYGGFLSSMAHLSVLTAFLFAVVVQYFFYVDTEKRLAGGAALSLLVYPAAFLLLYGGLYSLVFHSNVKLNILDMKDFSLPGVWGLFLVFVWGVALALLFFRTHLPFFRQGRLAVALCVDGGTAVLAGGATLVCPVLEWPLFLLPYVFITSGFYMACRFRKIRRSYLYLLLWAVLYGAFVSLNFLELNIQKSRGKYRVLAQNVYANGNVENDRIADLLLEELDKLLEEDSRIGNYMAQPDSVGVLKDYLDKTYFRGFWNKYDVQLTYAPLLSDVYREYAEYVGQMGSKISRTHFYSVPTTQNAMTYIGVFGGEGVAADSACYFMEFYPRREYKSYSFPDLLMPASADIHKQLNVSVAKYDDNCLAYSSGRISYPSDTRWMPGIPEGKDFATVLYDGHWHYIYRPDEETCIVVSKQHRNDFTSYLRFFAVLSLVYFFVGRLLVKGGRLVSGKEELRWGLATRFQYAFVFLLILSFAGVFYFSVDFIERRYQNRQVETLESKRAYIQSALQNMYYWNQSLDAGNTSSLNFDLQELSYTYQTDIHVFDNNGLLVGSSQPLIFYRNLVGNRMSPRPYFATEPDMELHEHIGELDYLAAYTDFYNGDYLQIGYIAVPQFLSEEDMRVEIENFSSVIVHIYLFIILLAVLLTVVVGRRLSAPLHTLERKLKEMHIGQRNEKIDYRYNDEIGQLVAQYNRTVDELELSARRLAQSERESAWKSMARQVAHEINNPLTPMKLSIQQLQRRKDMDDEGFDDYFRRTTAMLVEQIDNLSRIAGTFSDFARMPEARLAQVDVGETLQSVARLFANNKEHVEVVYRGMEEPVFVFADAEQLIQVFNNLIKNAIQAIPKERDGRVDVSLGRYGQSVRIAVADNGNGVPEEIRDKMFTPNFTTKAQGMGLGLAISKKIVEQFGGTITFEAKAGEGSVFRVELPGSGV